MREICTSGLEGGASQPMGRPYPYRYAQVSPICVPFTAQCLQGAHWHWRPKRRQWHPKTVHSRRILPVNHFIDSQISFVGATPESLHLFLFIGNVRGSSCGLQPDRQRFVIARHEYSARPPFILVFSSEPFHFFFLFVEFVFALACQPATRQINLVLPTRFKHEMAQEQRGAVRCAVRSHVVSPEFWFGGFIGSSETRYE